MTRARIYSQSGVGGNVTSNVAANVTLATLIPFLTTSNVTELVNLYFTNARVFANLQLASINAFQDVNTANSANGQALLWDGSSNIWYPGNVISLSTITPFLTTANVTESNSNLYYTNARARTALSPADPTIIIDYSTGTIRANILAVSNASGTSDTVPEGFTNLYFTNARVKTALSLANLVDIGDVTYTGTPSNNQVLTWNSVGGYWTNTTGAAGASASFAETSNVANTVLTLSNFTTYDLAPDPNGVNPYYSNAAVLALFSPGGNTQITTSNIAEGSNLYYTNARVNAMITVAVTDSITPFLTTANVRETSNLYYTNARVLSYVGTLSTSNLAEGSNLYYTNTRVISAVLPYLTTSNVAESTSNLYFTNARVYANIAPLLTTANIIESVSNLYYTNARVNAFIQPWLTTANLLESANSLFYTNARVLANIAVSNIATKFLTVTGNIYATDNVTTSKNLILAKNASAASANGLGIYIDGANASILYNDNTQSLDVNKNIIVTGNILPSTSGVFNLGSPDKKFLSLYLGTQTLFIGNISLGESPRGGLAIQTPNGLPSDASFANITATEAVTLSRFSNVELGLEANGYFGGNVAQFINNKTGNIYYGIKKNDNWGSFAGMRVSETRTIAEPVYPTYTWNVVNSFSDGYVLSGYSSGTDIPLTVTAGDTLVFSVNAPTHPFWIKTSQVTGTGSGVTTGTIIGNGTAVGNVSWNTTGVVPGTYYYICQVHASMGSTITVLADIYPKGNVRSDIIFYNDNEITNNSVARLSLLGNGNNIIFGNVYQDSGSLLYANIVGNVTGRVSTLDNHTTSNLVEGNNLYYTNSRVRSTLSAGTGVSYDSTTGSIAIGQNVSTTATVTFSRVTVTDNLTVYGNVTTYGANNLAISDNMIYLNNDSYNSNPDIGFTFNYNDGTYHHGGFFRDASDGIFKVFENYLPEPDANIFIDTNDASFRLANIQATSFYGNLIGTVSNLSNFTTDSLAEGLNLYYTNARVNSFIQGNLAGKSNVTDLTTANVTELTNLYYTNARVNSFIQGNLATKANVTDLTTSNVVEGTSQYFTNARVLANVSQMSINVFADVDISGIQTNDSLLWNGTSFVAGTLSLDQANTAGLANVANTVLTLSNFTTANLAEGINLYYTNARVISAVSPYLTTSNVAEGSNLYYTNSRVYAAIEGNLATKANVSDLNTSNVAEGTNLYYTNARVYSNVIALLPALAGAGIQIQANGQINSNIVLTLATLSPFLTTSNVAEGSNLYYTNARVVSAVTPYLTTANVIETSANLYFTNARVLANVSQMSINVFADVDMTGLQTSGILIWNGSAFVAGTVSAAATSNSALFSNLADRANTAELANVANSVLSISNFTTANLVEGINLYYTNARVVSAVTPYLTTSNVIEGANLYFTNTRAAIGLTGQDISVKDLYAAGNLTVQGDFTTLNVATLNIEDKNITLGKGLTTSAQADSAGITIDGAQANITYLVSGDKFNINKNVEILGDIKANTWTGLYSGNVLESTNQYFTNARAVLAITPYLTTANVLESASNLYYTNARVFANVSEMSVNVFTDVDITGIVNDELLLWNGFDRVFRPSSFSNKLTTANVVELTNLYFTNARVITALSTGTANLSLYNLSTTGVLTVSSGTNDESVAGLEFSNNPAGGAGDTAKIKYFAANIGVNDDTILEISVANNPGDSINFKTMGGGVGVNVARPIAEFDVGGNINARNSLIFSSVVVGPTAQFNAVTANTWNNLYTSNVIEGNNLYYTNARVLSIVTPLLTTSNVIEGSNLYYTNARVYAAIQGNLATKANVVDLTTANVIELNNLYYTNSRVLSIVTPLLTTANVLESSSNLYYTNSRAILAAIPAVTQLTVTTPVFNYNIDQYTGDNPTIYVTAGETISFNLNIGASHPFNIRISNGGTNYDVGLTHVALDGTISTGASAQGKVAGKLFWKVPYVLAGSTYVYQCTNHGSMIGNIVIQRPVGAITTENVTENVNLYYTNARVNSFIQGNLATKANVTDLTTANVSELTNLYYTNARVFANVAQMSVNVFADVDITGVSTGYGLVWDGSKFVTLAPSSSIATANIAIFASSANVANTVLSIDNFTTANLTEGTNLYFTNARVISGLVGQDVSLNNLTVAGDLVVQGNTVTLNTATLIVEDKNILLANGATNSATADGAGFNIAGAQANLTYRSTGDKFEFNKPLDIFGNVKVASAINYANTTNVTKVYQYYNESTQSLDTIFV